MPEASKVEEAQNIHRDLNPGAGLQHRQGQPKRAPYAKDSASNNPAKFLTNCSAQHADSLKCIERNYQNRAACEPFFAAYKACRKEENEKRKEASASKGWFF